MTYADTRILIEAYGKQLTSNTSFAEIERLLDKLADLKKQMIVEWAARR